MRLGVVERVHSAKIQLARDHRIRESLDVVTLLARETGAGPRASIESRDSRRRDMACSTAEPQVRGAARCERDLLLEDDLHEGGEARLAIPERRRTVTRDDPRQVGIAVRERAHPAGEGAVGQPLRHHR